MIKIKRRKHRSVPTLNMSSMPDLIFTVLFFFMIVTHMRTETVKVPVEVPQGKELQKAARHLVTNIYVGMKDDKQPLIQVAGEIVPLGVVGAKVAAQRASLSPESLGEHTVNIRADRHIPMWVVTDIKKQLRQAGALTIRYMAMEE